MQAIRIHHFGDVDALVVEDVPRPAPGEGEVLLRVKAAGVGPWDALIRSGKSVLPQPLPLTLGSDLSGVVYSVGPRVERFKIGDEVFGVTNERFTGAYAEYAVAKATMIAHKPKTLNYTHAASVPVVAVTAWQMVFEYAGVAPGQFVLIHGGAGSVGAYLLQLAKRAGAMVVTTAAAKDTSYVRGLGAYGVIDYGVKRFEEQLKDVDAVLDTVGGDTLERSYGVLSVGGFSYLRPHSLRRRRRS